MTNYEFFTLLGVDPSALRQSRAKAEKDFVLPQNLIPVGSPEQDDLTVFIGCDVYEGIEAYAAADTSVERGTILLGDVYGCEGRRWLVISDYIEARYAVEEHARLTFTHETWNYVHSVLDEQYPGLRIVGWQHTHPGFGVFLSGYDTFIHENFFNLDFQVAYVVDPLADNRGFFCSKGGRIEGLKGFWLYDGLSAPMDFTE